MDADVRGGAERTRQGIVRAFNRLFLRAPQPRVIGVRDLTSEAAVGRSTFYDHFSSADDVFLTALANPFATLADAAAGRGEIAATTRLLGHFWTNRSRARSALDGRTGEQVLKLLVELVEARLPASSILPPRLAAEQCASAALGPVRAWLRGRSPATPEALAAAICRSGKALAAALTAEA
jgi:AcrR family transcriptional regulator